MPLRICVEGERTLPLLPICARPPKTANSRSRGECLEVAVIDLRGKAGSSQWVKSDVLVQFKREPIRAYGSMEGDKHLPLLGIADTLDGPDQPGSLRHEKLLVIVRIVVGGEHDQNRARSSRRRYGSSRHLQAPFPRIPGRAAPDSCRSHRAPSDRLLAADFVCCASADFASIGRIRIGRFPLKPSWQPPLVPLARGACWRRCRGGGTLDG